VHSDVMLKVLLSLVESISYYNGISYCNNFPVHIANYC